MTSKSDFTDEEWALILRSSTNCRNDRGHCQNEVRRGSASPSPWLRPMSRHVDGTAKSENFSMRLSRRNLSGITRALAPPRRTEATRTATSALDSVALLQRKAAPEEVEEYRQFIRRAVAQGRGGSP